MKWSELPKRYRKLEEGFDESAFDEQKGIIDSIENIAERFSWDDTSQGLDFWLRCNSAKSIEELPPIPYIVRDDAPNEFYVKVDRRKSIIKVVNGLTIHLGDKYKWNTRWDYIGYQDGESNAFDVYDSTELLEDLTILTFKQFKYYFMGYGKPKSLKTKEELNPEADECHCAWVNELGGGESIANDSDNVIAIHRQQSNPLLKAAFEKVGLNETDKTVSLIKDVTDAVREFQDQLTLIAESHG